jgi:hypothetical protein
MSNEIQREIVHRDATGRAHYFESDGSSKRLVQEEKRHSTSFFASLVRAIVGPR